MKEKEVKFLEVNKKDLITKLKKAGAKKIFEGDIDAVFFDFSDNYLKKQDKLLRLRKHGNEIEFASKEIMPKKDIKIVEELAVHVDNFNQTRKILKVLGFKEVKHLPIKHRVSFELNKVFFEFDTFKGLPTYLEFEVQDERKIKWAINLLNLNIKDAKPWTQTDVLKYYKKKY